MKNLTKAIGRTVATNTKKRLRVLGVSAYKASILAGFRGGWLTDTLRRGGHISLTTLAEIGMVVGLPPFEILTPGAPCKAPPPKHWKTDD